MTKALKTATCAALVVLLCLLVSGCGGEDNWAAGEPGEPVGTAVLPDLMPSPQRNVLTRKVDGRWEIVFNTIIANVGDGEFIFRAKRDPRGTWRSEQDIVYSTSGALPVRIQAPLVWGGDGHDHWHIVRVASVWLVPLDLQGDPVSDSKERIDTKIGFCFYDHTHELDRGPAEAVYAASSCGDEDATVVGMGLSPGWNDTYLQSLRGQSIDVTGLADGKYRLFTEVDERGMFREKTRANNRTWIDLELRMTPKGLFAPTIGTGPTPS